MRSNVCVMKKNMVVITSFYYNMSRFIALSDDEWCHKFLGMAKGHHLISLGGFMRFWGYVFIVTTIFIWLFKDEEHVRSLFSFSVREKERKR